MLTKIIISTLMGLTLVNTADVFDIKVNPASNLIQVTRKNEQNNQVQQVKVPSKNAKRQLNNKNELDDFIRENVIHAKEKKEDKFRKEKLLPIETKLVYDVPFSSQAPFGNWSDPRQEYGCEEAAATMAIRWIQEKNLSKKTALNHILRSSEYEKKNYGEFHDTSAKDTINWILRGYFGYDLVELRDGITKKDIKRQLKQGNIVMVPVNGRILDNPHYTPPGPIEHMILVIGYDPTTDEFITHDPGTRFGAEFRYREDTLNSALQDYNTGLHEPINRTEKKMIIIRDNG
jgi:hypothetical protein